MPAPSDEVTRILAEMGQGERSAAARLFPVVYEELRVIARTALRQHGARATLHPTELVHEAFLRLVDQTAVTWNDRSHFLAVASEVIRRVLVDHARRRARLKRGGDRARVTLDEAGVPASEREVDLLSLDSALSRYAELDQRRSRVVVLRFFGGMTIEQVANVLGVSPRTVNLDWEMARAWLHRELCEQGNS